MADLARIRYVADHYDNLQGLRIVPLGIPFLLSAAYRAGWFDWVALSDKVARYVFFGELAVAVAVSYVIRAAYRRRFGMVLPSRRGAWTLLALVISHWRLDAAERHLAGREIFRQECAKCHGRNGEGVKGKYDGPLQGERSLEKLARYIERNMARPRESPGDGRTATDPQRRVRSRHRLRVDHRWSRRSPRVARHP